MTLSAASTCSKTSLPHTRMVPVNTLLLKVFAVEPMLIKYLFLPCVPGSNFNLVSLREDVDYGLAG